MTTNPLFEHLAWMIAHPFIPELHQDDCDDMACVRCEPTANPIERLDVPLADLVADLQPEPAEQRIAAGLAAEYRHLLLDADPGSSTPAFVDLHHHKSCSRSTR
ncbi:hypothetical protein ABZS93_15970 [Streptomyces sp900116325]|uniref:hypothetical protein n=1 Tax=Streptomyces sp. 900116325 TaxID=3154295 RepID=UPI0033B29492